MGKISTRFEKWAFNAIQKNKPKHLKFCLTKLKVDPSATTKQYPLLQYRISSGLLVLGSGHRCYSSMSKIDMVQFAVSKNKIDCLEVLLQHGANLYPTKENYTGSKYIPPLHMAMDVMCQKKDGDNSDRETGSSYQMLRLLLRLVFSFYPTSKVILCKKRNSLMTALVVCKMLLGIHTFKADWQS